MHTFFIYYISEFYDQLKLGNIDGNEAYILISNALEIHCKGYDFIVKFILWLKLWKFLSKYEMMILMMFCFYVLECFT